MCRLVQPRLAGVCLAQSYTMPVQEPDKWLIDNVKLIQHTILAHCLLPLDEFLINFSEIEDSATSWEAREDAARVCIDLEAFEAKPD